MHTALMLFRPQSEVVLASHENENEYHVSYIMTRTKMTPTGKTEGVQSEVNSISVHAKNTHDESLQAYMPW